MKKILKRLLIIIIAAVLLCGTYKVYTLYNSQEESAQDKADGTLVSDESGLEDSGITGEGYTFDTLYYPYCGLLDETQQALYAQICANAEAYCDTFVPVVTCTADDVSIAMESVFCDHPEYFWLETAYSYKYTSEGTCVQIILSFYDIVEDIDTAKALFEDAAQSIIEAAASCDSDYDKEKYVHDAVISLVSYNEDADYSQSAYSALVTGQTVCAGYARAFQYIMIKLGIPAYYCMGYSGGDHAWNIVMLSDGYYNVDLTWDDSDPISYIFFNCTDSAFAATHTRSDISGELPACTATTYCNLENSGGPGSYPGTPGNSSEDNSSDNSTSDSADSDSQSNSDSSTSENGTTGSGSSQDNSQGSTDSSSQTDSGSNSDESDGSSENSGSSLGSTEGSRDDSDSNSDSESEDTDYDLQDGTASPQTSPDTPESITPGLSQRGSGSSPPGEESQ